MRIVTPGQKWTQKEHKHKVAAADWLLYDKSTEAQVARVVASAIVGGYVAGPVVMRFMAATKPARNVLTWLKHPLAKALATQTNYRAVQLGAQAYLTGTKAIRYMSIAVSVYTPFETYRYLTERDYKRAALQWYGPPGTVYMYNQLTMEPVNSPARMEEIKQLSKPKEKAKPSISKKKKSSMTAKQRRRLNRMGLRYCPTHRRYDRCARK